MSGDTVIRVEGVSKKFSRSLKHVMAYGAKDIAKNLLGLQTRSDQLRDGEFWAVDGVSFEVKRGETLGLIGANGSGKSTLLKMLNGIFMPDKGKIEIKGRVGALIEVGAGFHPMLTGRENIYVNGAVLGMSKKEIDKRFDVIVDFADIGDFIDSPVKHYSSGMYVRLGFAVAVHSNPDILLIDEVLAVGDIAFQAKCMDKVMDMRSRGTTTILVTHDSNAVKKFCQSAFWLKDGHPARIGEAIEVSNAYIDFLRAKKTNVITERENAPESPSSAYEALPQIISIEMVNAHEELTTQVVSGESVRVKIKYRVPAEIKDKIIIGVAIHRNDNVYVCGLHTGLDAVEVIKEAGEHELVLNYPSLNLLTGAYHLKAGIFHSSALISYDFDSFAYDFRVTSLYPAEGVIMLEHTWKAT